jgi:hypothetical protein
MCQSIYFSLPLEKRWGGGGRVDDDVIFSTELLKGIICHGDFQALLGFLCTDHTEQNWLRGLVSLPSLPACPSPTACIYSLGDSQAALIRNLGQEVGESFLDIFLGGELWLCKQLLVRRSGGQLLARHIREPGTKGKMIFPKGTQRGSNSCIITILVSISLEQS